MTDNKRFDRAEELWRIYQPTGDPDAYEELYNIYADWLFVFLKRKDHGDKCADIAYSETWSRVWTRRSELAVGDGGRFWAWIKQIAWNLLRDCLKKKANQTSSLTGPVANQDPRLPEPWQVLIDQEVANAKAECIEEHGGEFLEMERMKIAGMSAEEIADELDLSSAEAVSKRKNKLKKETIAKIIACVEEKLS